MGRVEVLERPIEDAAFVNARVFEFGMPYDRDFFEERIKDKKHLIIVGHIDGEPAGYMVGYEDERYPNAFYLWMAGVSPEFRGKGVLKSLMDFQQKWAGENGYSKLVLKTRNERRQMLNYLVKYGWNFVAVYPKEKIEETEILAEKII